MSALDRMAEEIAERLAQHVDQECLLLAPDLHLKVLANLRDRFAAAHDRQPTPLRDAVTTLVIDPSKPAPFTLVGCIVVDTDTEEG